MSSLKDIILANINEIQATQVEKFKDKAADIEMFRVKSVLALKRNATRDYLDIAAMSRMLGDDGVRSALEKFDAYYPQPNGASPLQQLANQLSNPLPFDLEIFCPLSSRKSS